MPRKLAQINRRHRRHPSTRVRIPSGAGLSQLAQLRRLHPENAMVWLHSALALDRRGREAEAIPLYQRALRLGLMGLALRDAFVCLASSLREVGKSRAALTQLLRAHIQFPNDKVVRLFLALTYHDRGQKTKALKLLAMAYLDDAKDRDLKSYRPALHRKYKSLSER
jgi:Flp pilus assembly protein TadD